MAANVARSIRLRLDNTQRAPTKKRTVQQPVALDWAAGARFAAGKLRVRGMVKSELRDWSIKYEQIAKYLRIRKGNYMDKPVKPKEIMRLLEKQEFRCAYTRATLTPDNISADHFVPVSEGGSHSIDNIRLVTREINRAKGTLSYAEFVKLCKDVVDSATQPVANTQGSENGPEDSGTVGG